MVLAGFTKLPTLDDDTKLIANELRELRESIAKLELPQDLKKAILYRIGQIITAIEHFILFGSEQLVTEISTLVGVLVLPEKALNHESKASIKKLGAYISKLLSGIEKLDKGANGASGLLEKGQSVLKLFSDQ